jgi:hypothetical protein
MKERGTPSLEPFHMRFSVGMKQLAAPDDISRIEDIQQQTKLQVRIVDVQATVARLFASLFYVEAIDSKIEYPDRMVTIPGKCCYRSYLRFWTYSFN